MTTSLSSPKGREGAIGAKSHQAAAAIPENFNEQQYAIAKDGPKLERILQKEFSTSTAARVAHIQRSDQ